MIAGVGDLMSDKCVRCGIETGIHFGNEVCGNCLTPYESKRMEEGLVVAEFYDNTRSIIAGLLNIIRQEVYPSMNRVPECDHLVIESAQFEVGDLRDDIKAGLAPKTYKLTKHLSKIGDEAAREQRRSDIAKTVKRMNKHWADNATYPNPTYKIGWFEDEIRIPYPEGCYPITRVRAESAPFVLADSWIRPEEVSE